MKQSLFGLWLAVVGLLSNAAGAAESPVEAVMRVDATRLRAMMAGDGAALGRVFSDAIIFSHSDGRLETKAEYIKNMTAGDTAYAEAKTSAVKTLQATPDVVVLLGRQTMRKKLGPQWSDLDLRFMSVWRNEGGTWRMVAWQSLRPAGNSTVPPKLRPR
jgi:ketosteroid isomerase-like protein